MKHLLPDLIAILLVVAAFMAAAWAWGMLRRGPGPNSRLERLLDDHERDEAARRAAEDRDDEEAV